MAYPLDNLFGRRGRVTTDVARLRTADTRDSRVLAATVLKSGKILAAGSASWDLLGKGVALARYHRNGRPDRSFCNGGRVVRRFGHKNDEVLAAEFQRDGRVVVTGGSHLVGTVVIARFDRDGRWDPTFGKGGQAIIRFDRFRGPELLARSTAVQRNGMIVIAGTRGVFPNKEIVLMRCRANGTLDSGFGTGGQVIMAFGGESDGANAVTVQKDGKIVVAGQLDRGQLINSPHFALIRYNADGTLDQSFGAGGVAAIKFAGDQHAVAFTVAIQPDGKIVAAGMQGRQSKETFAVARFNSDGTLDDTFGRGGKLTTSFSKHSSEAHALAIQRNRRIVVAGTVVVGFHSSGPFPHPDLPLTDFAVARYRRNGLLDRTFGFGGKVITDFNGPTDEAQAVIVRRGRALVAGFGRTQTLSGDWIDRFAMARYRACRPVDGAPPSCDHLHRRRPRALANEVSGPAHPTGP